MDLVQEKYLTINGKKQKWKKDADREIAKQKEAIPIDNGVSLLDYYTQKALGAIERIVVDEDNNAYLAESKEEADRIQQEIDRKGFVMVN